MKKIISTVFIVGFLAVGVGTLHAQSTSESIKIISPSGGQTLTLGEKIPVIWTSVGVSADASLIIELRSGLAGFAQISVKNTGSTSFSLPYQLPSSYLNKKFEIYVGGADTSGTYGDATSPFNVVSCSASCGVPKIKVLSPGVEDSFIPGGSITVKWASTNIPSTADILISLSPKPTNTNGVTILESPGLGYVLKTKNTGSVTFRLPEKDLFGPLLESGNKAFSNKYEVWVVYYSSEDGHLSMGSYPDAVTRDVFGSPSTTMVPFTDSIVGESNFFTISAVSSKQAENNTSAITQTSSMQPDVVSSHGTQVQTGSVAPTMNAGGDVINTIKTQTPKISFWHKVGNFFSKLKFW